MTIGLFRKKPVVIEAVQWDGTNINDVLMLVPRKENGDFDLPDDNSGMVKPGIAHVPSQGTLDIPTLEGTMTATLGDWIIKGVKGEIYPCKPDIFEETYEQVGEIAEGKLGETLDRLFPPGSTVDG